MHCGCSVHLGSSACVFCVVFRSVDCSGALSLRARYATATLSAPLVLDRMQVVVGLSPLGGEGRRLCTWAFRIPVPAAVRIFSAGRKCEDPGLPDRATHGNFALPSCRKCEDPELPAGMMLHTTTTEGCRRRDDAHCPLAAIQTRSADARLEPSGARRYIPGVRCSDICPLCF